MPDIDGLIRRLLADHFGGRVDEMFDNLRFYSDLGGDELDEVEMLMMIEDELEITLPDSMFDELLKQKNDDVTIKMIIDYVTEKTKQ